VENTKKKMVHLSEQANGQKEKTMKIAYGSLQVSNRLKINKTARSLA